MLTWLPYPTVVKMASLNSKFRQMVTDELKRGIFGLHLVQSVTFDYPRSDGDSRIKIMAYGLGPAHRVLALKG